MTDRQFPDDAASAVAWRRHALLTVKNMYAADEATMASGIPGTELMENAGAAVARAIRRRWKPMATAVLCGPGNNGGDGFVVARHLAAAGWPVRLALLGDRSALKGDAAWAASAWEGRVEPLSPDVVDGAELVVDALFGAGLSREIDGAAARTLQAAGQVRWRVAVDTPSGVAGDTAAVDPASIRADLTVTFFRRKPGHLLLPNREACGETVVADIGIPDAVLEAIRPTVARNHPDLWRRARRLPSLTDHKYTRGHLLVRGGAMMGAARLVALAAARSGAGMVSLACPQGGERQAAGLPASVILRPGSAGWRFALAVRDRKVAASVVGPGNGADAETFDAALAALGSGKPVVLDADALPGQRDARDALMESIQGPCVLTPHAGEFERFFGPPGVDRLDAVRRAAAAAGAVVVLKGGDTIVADPSGRAVINDNAPPWLATAGAGDVLAGMIGAFLAQGMAPFEAAAAGVWLHGEAARTAGPFLIADDLAGQLRQVMANIWSH